MRNFMAFCLLLFAGQIRANSEALAQLRDIHLPNPIGLWPLAFGWYLLFLISIGASLLLVYFVHRYYRNGSAKRRALRLLAQYQQAHEQNPDSQRTSSNISELLKRVALVYFPRVQVAGLQGRAWVDFLKGSSRDIDFDAIKDMLIELPYHPSMRRDLTPLFLATRQWIKQRSGRCLN